MKQYAKRPFNVWILIFLLAFLIVPINTFTPSDVLVKGDVVSASGVRDRMMEIAEAYENLIIIHFLMMVASSINLPALYGEKATHTVV